MRHRDRVLAALDHEATDRPPFHAVFVPEFSARLRRHFGLAPNGYEPHHRTWYGYELEELTDQDLLQASAGWVTNYYLHDHPFTDDWGVEWRIDPYTTPFGDGFYTNIEHNPLAGEGPDLDSYRPPDPNAPGLYDHVERLVRELGDEYWIVGRVHCTIFETAWALRGFENLLIDLYETPERAERVIDLPYRYHKEAARNLAERGVDMIWLGDDWAAQTGLLIDPGMWREFFQPRYADICRTIKAANPDCRIAYHSDGDVTALIPDLIDTGIEVLNPVQTDCMDPAELQRDFGERLSFFGGIAVQSTLPQGTPADIRAEYAWLRETIGQGGGWICSPTHHVQLDTPIENFLTLVDVAHGR
jgi:uroporphyrinogen decarboxylase